MFCLLCFHGFSERLSAAGAHAALYYVNGKVGKLEVDFERNLQPIPGDPKDNGVAAMLDDRTYCFVIQHGRHGIVFLHLQGLVGNHLYSF